MAKRTYNQGTVEQRLWARVDRRGPDECWPWIEGHQHAYGYGEVGVLGKMIRAHRLAYQVTHGPIPSGLHVRHACDNPPCCNPAHLLLGTHADNMRDMSVRHRASGGSKPGVTHPRAVLSDEQVREIRRRYADGGIRQSELAETFGISQARVSKIVRREGWAHLD